MRWSLPIGPHSYFILWPGLLHVPFFIFLWRTNSLLLYLVKFMRRGVLYYFFFFPNIYILRLRKFSVALFFFQPPSCYWMSDSWIARNIYIWPIKHRFQWIYLHINTHTYSSVQNASKKKSFVHVRFGKGKHWRANKLHSIVVHGTRWVNGWVKDLRDMKSFLARHRKLNVWQSNRQGKNLYSLLSSFIYILNSVVSNFIFLFFLIFPHFPI